MHAISTTIGVVILIIRILHKPATVDFPTPPYKMKYKYWIASFAALRITLLHWLSPVYTFSFLTFPEATRTTFLTPGIGFRFGKFLAISSFCLSSNSSWLNFFPPPGGGVELMALWLLCHWMRHGDVDFLSKKLTLQLVGPRKIENNKNFFISNWNFQSSRSVYS